jgi:DNA-binding CsgD family transcriptional regulator/type II secretory pathway predicted ATPase ExeA
MKAPRDAGLNAALPLAAPGRRARAGTVDTWPTVDRAEEFSRLSAAVCTQQGAVILGAAGEGKTTLARMGAELALGRGMRVARITATRASRQLPFGAIASIMPSDAEIGIPSEADQSQLLRRYIGALVDAAGPRPLLMFVDDAHLLDDGSAIIIHQLAAMRAATVLVTVRSGEMVPDPMTALWKDGLAERIDLRPLGEVAIEELLVTVLGAPMEEGSVRQLIDRCQGNPMFLRELVTGALEAGQLVGDGGIWRIRGQLHPTLRLVDLVTIRLGVLSDSERALLEFLALGEPLDHHCLDRLVEPAAVRALERKGLITSQLDGRQIRVRLAHPIYGDVVRAGLSAIREREMARALAEAMESAGTRHPEHTLRLAALRLIGGGGGADVFLAGAISSKARYDYILADRLARAAIEQGAGFEARLIAAWAVNIHGRTKQADSELAELANRAVSDAERARVALARFNGAFYSRGETNFALLYEAIDIINDQFWRNEIQARVAFAKGFARGPRTAVAAGKMSPRNAPGQTNTAAIFGLARMGRLEDARELLIPPSDSRTIPSLDAFRDLVGLLLTPAASLIYEGRLAEAEEFLNLAYLHREEPSTPQLRVIAACTLANMHLEQGRPLSALRRAHEANLLIRAHGGAFFASWGFAPAAQALALAGQGDRAADALAALDALGIPPNLMIASDVPRARAWTAVAEGNLARARFQFETAADLGEEVGDLVGAASAMHDLARIGCARQAAPRLTHLADQIDGDFVRARAGYAGAVAGRNSAELIKVGRRFEDMGAILYAAESFADASVLLRRAGMARAATAEEQKAARLLERCEGASTPPVRSMAARARLTAGELQTAVQASAGYSDKHIAHDRKLSVRTIESQLHRAYRKLGVSGRHDLAEALRDHPAR